MTTEELIPGKKVHFIHDDGSTENGIVKSLSEGGNLAFVVFKCADNWDNYQDYTGQSCRIEDLGPDWE